MKEQKPTVRRSEAGLVSIMVTMIIMIIISLVVLGFSRIVRREQRQTLDQQLSTQAFYAAESGVNDAVRVIKASLATPGAILADKLDCAPNADFPGPYDVDAANNVSYSCLLVDMTPPALVYDPVDTARSTVVPIRPKNTGDILTKIKISWQDKDGGSNAGGCPATGTFPAAGAWPNASCDAGIMRVDLVPTSGPLTRAGLVSNMFTAFLQPRPGGGGNIAYTSARGFPNQGAIVDGNCAPGAGDRFCNVTIDLAGFSSSQYHLRLKSIYKPSTVTITAETAAGITELYGSQAVVDVTGKANDILRRVQVHVPINNANEYLAEFPLESVDTICKRMRVAPGEAPSFDPMNPACSP